MVGEDVVFLSDMMRIPDTSGSHEALQRIQSLARSLRDYTPVENDLIDSSVPIGVEERVGHINGKPCKRLVIFLRSTGCEWVRESGGCTMCGFYCSTRRGVKVSDEDYINQIRYVAETVDLNDYPIVALYNDGNFLDVREMSFDAQKQISSILGGFPGIRRLVIESRINDDSIEMAKKIKKLLPDTELQILFGFESANPEVMNLCINKGFTAQNYDHYLSKMNGSGVSFKPLLLLKPPFLTEQEAISDVVKTIGYLHARGIHSMDLEVTTVEKNTVVHELWKKGLYVPPMLWSVLEVIRQYKEKYGNDVNMYISPSQYSVESLDVARNCGKCDGEILERIERHNIDFNMEVFADLDCTCKHAEWEKKIREQDEKSIPERIISQLNLLGSPD